MERATIADAVPRHTDQKHPPQHLVMHVRGAFLAVVQRECPRALVDLRRYVFGPLMRTLPAPELMALLTRRYSHPADLLPRSRHRRVRASIARWAARWEVDAPWIHDQAWRTLLFWARHPQLMRHWAPLINTHSSSARPADARVLRPRDCRVLTWLVRTRICRPASSFADVAADPAAYVSADSVRVQVNRLAKTLDLSVRRPGRRRSVR